MVALALLDWASWPPIPANIIGFLTAFSSSFVGHSYWTFRGHEADFKNSLARLLLVNVFGFLLNNGVLWLLVSQTSLSDEWSVVIAVAVVPPLAYLASKFWVFRG